MNDLTASYERQTGQLIIDGLPAGVAGEARLVPAAGTDLAFDRADGHLVRAVVDAAAPDAVAAPGTADAAAAPAAPDGADATGEASLLIRLFGREAARELCDGETGQPRALRPEPGLSAALSSLARLDAARATSPAPHGSPWWAAEAAELAHRAGLSARARAEARRAVRGLAEALMRPTLPEQACRTALAVVAIAAADEPAAASRLREKIGVVHAEPLGRWLAWQPRLPGRDVAAEVENLEKDQARLPGLHWMLDPDLVPQGLFRPGLSPHSDLCVRPESGPRLLVVEALPTPGAERAAAGCCQARLVDPALRRVLAQAGFHQAGSRIRAELVLGSGLDELRQAWIEVVQGKLRPVRSDKAHRIRRALRWADAALRAERAPAGLAPQSTGEDWSALAAVAWERCRRDWEAAGDTRRADLAAAHTASAAAHTASATGHTASLAGRASVPGPSYLAELLGG